MIKEGRGMSLGSIIRKLRKENGIDRQQLADSLGITYYALAKYETDDREPDYNTLKKFADYFDVSIDYLLGLTDDPTPYSNAVPQGTEKFKEPGHDGLEENMTLTRMAKIPIYSMNVKEGEEIFAESNIIGWRHVPVEQMNYICFKITDDSMSGSGIYTDYIVTVKKQNTAVDGQLVTVRLNNGSVLMRRVRYFNDEVLLDPENPGYLTKRVKAGDIEIIGVVTDVTFKVK